MTIYEIKQRTLATSPYFFSRSTMQFFHQTLRSFHVIRRPDGRYYIWAPMRDHSGRLVGRTERLFNPTTNELEGVES